MLKRLLAHRLTKGLDLDDPRTTELRERIVQSKPFLVRVYEEWYDGVLANLPDVPGSVVELGSGGGFLRRRISGLITTELLPVRGVSLIADAQALPFVARSVRAIVMINVLHHIPQPRRFFSEAARCIDSGGRLILVEPWVTAWSRLVYTTFKHEPFDPHTASWEFPSSGPLSGANGAVPWIMLARDRADFEKEFPEWEIRSIEPMMPFRYLLSGGVSLRSLMPAWSFGFWKLLEKMLQPWMNDLALFATAVLVRR